MVLLRELYREISRFSIAEKRRVFLEDFELALTKREKGVPFEDWKAKEDSGIDAASSTNNLEARHSFMALSMMVN